MVLSLWCAKSAAAPSSWRQRQCLPSCLWGCRRLACQAQHVSLAQPCSRAAAAVPPACRLHAVTDPLLPACLCCTAVPAVGGVRTVSHHDCAGAEVWDSVRCLPGCTWLGWRTHRRQLQKRHDRTALTPRPSWLPCPALASPVRSSVLPPPPSATFARYALLPCSLVPVPVPVPVCYSWLHYIVQQ